MSGSAGTGNEEAKTTFSGGSGIGHQTKGGAVGTDHAGFRSYPRLAEQGLGGPESRPVRAAAHNQADHGVLHFQVP